MRWPLLPTILVAAAVAAMIGLGVWQLQRRGEKEALLVRLAANPRLPAIAYPRPGVDAEPLLFRKTSAFCLQPVEWQRIGGTGVGGTRGWRQIATCRTGAEGPGVRVDIGVSADAKARPAWRGGEVSGIIAHAPAPAGIANLFGHRPPAYMIVADRPLTGLDPSRPPSLDSISNNHLFYALQWFFFAAAAAVIYVLALRRRSRRA